MFYSFIIPVYNRPEEIRELLQSMTQLKASANYTFEVVIVEDGSTITCQEVVDLFATQLYINYLSKENTGPGDSRNYGMQHANGEYYIILDSDVILPSQYLIEVDTYISRNLVSCFGGPDAAHPSFNSLQKAISFAMTSFLTTGGIRGSKISVDQFQPRSFNMGLSPEAFKVSGGFGRIHPGEDPDLVIRLWNLGYTTNCIPDAYVYHKRRISWNKFYQQVHKFGMVRPILNKWHPETAKITYWFPLLFCLYTILAFITALANNYTLLFLLLMYFTTLFFVATITYKNLFVSAKALIAVLVQFIGYGWGFLKSYFYIHILNLKPEEKFPKLFFRQAP